jgi:hypothetical protein
MIGEEETIIALVAVCDECGEPATSHLFLATGRVLIDGEDKGQDVDLCEKHRPKDEPGTCQPHNCQRVVFYWPVALGPSRA